MVLDEINKHSVILASRSPRRQRLLEGCGIKFKVKLPEKVNETFPETFKAEQIALHLAHLKSDAFGEVSNNEIVITADTIVWMGDKVLDKPENYDEAVRTLSQLSTNCHDVITGVCLRSATKRKTFHVTTRVYFDCLTEEEIEYYVSTYKPYDKAGAYGIQEWIGFIGVEKIEGSFYNVMGLPVHQLYRELVSFIKH